MLQSWKGQAKSPSVSELRKKAFCRLPGPLPRVLNMCLSDIILYCRTGELSSWKNKKPFLGC